MPLAMDGFRWLLESKSTSFGLMLRAGFWNAPLHHVYHGILPYHMMGITSILPHLQGYDGSLLTKTHWIASLSEKIEPGIIQRRLLFRISESAGDRTLSTHFEMSGLFPEVVLNLVHPGSESQPGSPGAIFEYLILERGSASRSATASRHLA
jgi:hypothetical protein